MATSARSFSARSSRLPAYISIDSRRFLIPLRSTSTTSSSVRSRRSSIFRFFASEKIVPRTRTRALSCALRAALRSFCSVSNSAIAVRVSVWRKVSQRSARRPAELASAEEMQVDVKHRLAGVRACVDDDAVAVGREPFRRGEGLGDQHQPSEHLRVRRLVQGGHVGLRDYEDMGRRLGVDVAKGDRVLVLVHELRRYLATHDAAEQTAVGHVDLRSARARARPAMPAVSKRRTLEPSDAARHPLSANAARSAGSSPPSGPHASRRGACAWPSTSTIGWPRPSRRTACPDTAVESTLEASASGSTTGSHAPAHCSRAATMRRRSFSWNAGPSPRGVTLRERRYATERHAEAPSSTAFSASISIRSRSPTGAQSETWGSGGTTSRLARSHSTSRRRLPSAAIVP